MDMRRALGLLAVSLIGCSGCATDSTSSSASVLPSISGITAGGTTGTSAGNGNALTVASAPLLAQYNADAYHLGSFVAGYVMDVSGNKYDDNTPLIHYPETGGSNQLWRFVAASATGKGYRIENPTAGKCVDVAGQVTTNGAALVLNDCGAGASQQWTAARDANLNLVFRNLNSNLCLAVAGGNTAAAAPLTQATCDESASQSWSVFSKTTIKGYANTQYLANANNTYTSISFDMTVPAQPQATGSLFFVPALGPMPGTASFQPIGLGALEPVLSWGGSCAGTAQPPEYSTWWVSGQYLNGGTNPNYSGCLSGSAMSVNVGDSLSVSLQLQGTVWTQTVLDNNTNQSVTYALDMQGQAQITFAFGLVEYSVVPVADMVFQNIKFTVANADNSFCAPVAQGQTDYVAGGVLSSDMRTCTVAKVTLRAQNVPATTPNQ